MPKANVVDWLYTKWYLRLIRVLIAMGIAIGFWIALDEIFEEQAFLLQNGLFMISVGFLLCGPYVYILCKYNIFVSKFDAPDDLNTLRHSSLFMKSTVLST